MKEHRILKDFKGSQDGNDGPFAFAAGTKADLSDGLARIAVGEGWAEPWSPGLDRGPIPAAAGPETDGAADLPAGPDPAEETATEAETPPDAGSESKGAETPDATETADDTPGSPAELRETKVVEPQETKPAKATSNKGKK